MPGTTAFPAALDDFPFIGPTSQEDAEGLEHDVVHNNEAAAIAALEVKVGINESDDQDSLDYRISALESGEASSGALYHKRTTLTAEGGEIGFTTDQDIYGDAWSVVLDGVPLDDDAVMKTSSKVIALSTVMHEGQKALASYWSQSPIEIDTSWTLGADPLSITGTFPSGVLGIDYSESIVIAGGTTPYSLTGGTGIASGTPPVGLSLSISGTSLILSGTPGSAGTSSFVASVKSSDTQTKNSAQSIFIASSPGHRWWRVYVTAITGSNAYLIIGEIEMRSSIGGSNECSSGTPFAGSTLSGYPASNAFDRSTGDDVAWVSNGRGSPEFIGYNFATGVDIVEIRGFSPRSSDIPNRSPEDFSIQYSDDSTNGTDGTWTTSWSVTAQTGWGSGEMRTFTKP